MGFAKRTIGDYTALNEFADEFEIHDATWSASQLTDEPYLQFVCMFTKAEGCIVTAVLKEGKINKVDLPKSKRAPDVFVPAKTLQLVKRVAMNKELLQEAIDKSDIMWT